MKRIGIGEAHPGMKLAKPVENSAGMILYGEGMELTVQMIGKLETLNIESICIEAKAEPRMPIEAYFMSTETAFSKTGGDSLTAQFRNILLLHIRALYDE